MAETWTEHAARLDKLIVDCQTHDALIGYRKMPTTDTLKAVRDELDRLRAECERHAWKPITTCPEDEQMVQINARIGFIVIQAKDASKPGWLATHWREHTPPTTEGTR